MQKVMLFLASMLIVFSLSSCSKDDDSTITISPKEVTMKVDENKQLQTTGDIQKKLKRLFAGTIEQMLEAEMDEHLGYEKNSVAGNNSGNSRNGYGKKDHNQRLR